MNFNSIDINQNNSNKTIKILKIASWNLQIFGKKKSSDYFKIFNYISIIKNFDIVFLQELRDSSQLSVKRLCYFLKDYYCYNSSRSGKSKSKEQYILIIRKNIKIIDIKDYNLDKKSINLWERPPLRLIINYSNIILTIFTIHTKPSNTKKEIENLINVVNLFEVNFNPIIKESEKKILILGDLNADCSYYKWKEIKGFKSYIFQDTTTKKSLCSYDKILSNNYLNNNIISYGILEVPSFLSDHKLIWVNLN